MTREPDAHRDPEQIAADAIVRAIDAHRGASLEVMGRAAVEFMSATELLIVPAARMQGLLAIERALPTSLATAWERAIEAAAKAADRRTMLDGDCDQLGPTDWETGVRECALDLHDQVCPCLERARAAEAVRDDIRALTPPPDLATVLAERVRCAAEASRHG